jgi:ribonuclease VapC
VSVLDASALLAYLQGEEGAETVEHALSEGAVCSAINWSEVAQKVLAHGRDWSLSRTLLLSHDLAIEPVLVEDAELAASSWRAGQGLSIADRCCLALGERLGRDVLTADTAWGTEGRVRQIR